MGDCVFNLVEGIVEGPLGLRGDVDNGIGDGLPPFALNLSVTYFGDVDL